MKVNMYLTDRYGQYFQTVNNFMELDESVQLMKKLSTIWAKKNDFYTSNGKPHFFGVRVVIDTSSPYSHFRQFLFSDNQNRLVNNRFTRYEEWLYFLQERERQQPKLRGALKNYIRRIRPVLNNLEFYYGDVDDTYDEMLGTSLRRIELRYRDTMYGEADTFVGMDGLSRGVFNLLSGLETTGGGNPQRTIDLEWTFTFVGEVKFRLTYPYSARDFKYGSIRMILKSYVIFLEEFTQFWGDSAMSVLTADQKATLAIANKNW